MTDPNSSAPTDEPVLDEIRKHFGDGLPEAIDELDLNAPANGEQNGVGDPIADDGTITPNENEQLAERETGTSVTSGELSQILEKLTPIEKTDLRWIFILLTVLTIVAVGAALKIGQLVFLPIFLAWTFNLLLSPVVRFLKRYGIPCWLGAGVSVLMIFGVAALIATQLAGPFMDYADRLPELKSRIRQKMPSVFETLDNIERASNSAEAASNDEDEATAILVKNVDEPKQDSAIPSEILGGIAPTGATIFSTFVLLYFLLASGDHFLKKGLELIPEYEKKWKLVELARSVEGGISYYLLSITIVNIGLGIAVGICMAAVGMPDPVLWGSVATILNFIPFVGGLVGVSIVGLVGFTDPTMGTTAAIMAPLLYFACTALEGNVITPYFVGYRLDLNPPLIFISLLFWGWMWGVGGMILAVPILAALKILCDHVERLRPIASFLVR